MLGETLMTVKLFDTFYLTLKTVLDTPKDQEYKENKT